MTDFETEIQKSGFIAYTNRGDSMMPLIRENRDIVVIKKIEKPLKRNDAVLFKRENGAYVLHRIIKKCGSGVYLIGGDNRWFAEKIPEDRIIGILSEVIRDGKHITSDSAENKKYLHKLPFVRAKLKAKRFKYKVTDKLKRMFAKGAKTQNANEKNADYDYLLHLIACALHGAVPEEKPENVSFEEVFRYGCEHEVANIAYESVIKLKEKPCPQTLDLWNQYYYKSVSRDCTQKTVAGSIRKLLHSNGIYSLEVQGTVVKKYYPKPFLRMMSDIDFIIKPEDLEKVLNIMTDAGYEAYIKDDNEVHASKGNMFIEFHTLFFGEESVTDQIMDMPYTYAVLHDDFSAEVSTEVFYLFHLLHTIKHCNYSGAGIRRIIDLFYLETATEDKVDMTYIDGVLKENGFYDLKCMLFAVKDKWFNGIEPKFDTSLLEEDIKYAGNHGNDRLLYKYRIERNKNSGKKFVKTRMFLARAFPPKADIYESYPVCKEKKYPVVICWIYRFFASVFKSEKRKSIKNVYDNIKKG